MPINVSCIPYDRFILSSSLLDELSRKPCLLITPTYRILKPLARTLGEKNPTSTRLMPDFMLRSHFFKMGFPLEDTGTPASPYQELLCLYEAVQRVSGENSYLMRIQGKSFYDFIHFGRDIIATFQELIQGGKPILDQLDEIIEKVVHLRLADEKKFELLKLIYPEWEKSMKDIGCTTLLFAWDNFCRQSAVIDPSFLERFEHAVFLDYKPFTPLERILLQSLVEKSSPAEWSFLWQTGQTEYEKLKKHFPSDLFHFLNHPEPQEPSERNISITRYSTPLNEIAAVKKKIEIHLAEKDKQSGPLTDTLEQIAIIAPDSETVPSFQSFFPDDSLNISVGLPLQKNPVFDLLKRWESILTETVQSAGKKYFRLQNLFHFLYSPSIKRFIARKSSMPAPTINTFFQVIYLNTLETKENLFFHNSESLIKSWQKYFDNDQGMEPVFPALESLLNDFIFNLSGHNFSLSEGIGHLRSLLTPLFECGLEEAADERQDDLSAESSLDKAWTVLEGCVSSFQVSGTEILKVHNALLSGLTFSLPAPKHGISLMGYEEAALLNYQTVFLPDLSDKYPLSSSPRIFFNNQLRTQLGIPDQEFYYFTQKAAFEGILARARQASISFPQSQQSTIPSPFIHELRLEESRLEIKEDGYEYSRHFLERETAPSVIKPAPGSSASFLSPWEGNAVSISQLLQYIRCPYQAYLQKINLSKEPLYHLDDALSPPELGGIAHKIIHAILPSGIAFPDKFPAYKDFENALEQELQAWIHKHPHFRLVPKNNMTLHSLFSHSWEKFYYFQKERREQFYIAETEKFRKCVYLSRDIRFRLDRLDKNMATSGYSIIDYKTSRFKPDVFKKNIPTLRNHLNNPDTPDNDGIFLFSLKQYKGWDHFLEILFYGWLLSQAEKMEIEELILLYFNEYGFFQEKVDTRQEMMFQNSGNLFSMVLSLLQNQDSPLGYLTLLDDPNSAEQRKCFRIQAGTCRYCEYLIYCPFYGRFQKDLEKYMYRGKNS